jgi:hypothetical protein
MQTLYLQEPFTFLLLGRLQTGIISTSNHARPETPSQDVSPLLHAQTESES